MENHIPSPLNDRQIEAVTTIQGPMLIIAGAGSGKTRVITHRISHMLRKGIPQSAILALTFTNKAAREMGERVRDLTGKKLADLSVSTFHAFGVRVLRRTIHLLGYRENFSIYDSGDQLSLIKETARELRLSPDSLDLPGTAALFSGIKTGRRDWDGTTEMFRPLYQEYLSHLKAYNAVDFDDLIMLPIRIFGEHPETLAEYRQRYSHILVDEFQDTSANQYRLMKLLADGSRNVCVVGDDDQSIYSWRGANYENILRFEQDYPERREIKLEQNYRSTGTILAAANGVISHNRNRKTKALWTGSAEGRPIEMFHPEDERREGEFIAATIKTLMLREKVRYQDFGVLVRTNSLCRALEEAFLAEGLPYRVSGGESFFQRKEIKDILSYLRVMANPDDDVAFLRVVNTPRRGVGRRTLEQIGEAARRRSCSLYSAAALLTLAEDSPLGAGIRADLASFLALLEEQGKAARRPRNIAPTVRRLVEAVDYRGWLHGEFQKNDKIAKWKLRNIELLAQSIEDWEKDPENFEPGLYSYLNRVSLISRDDIDDEDGKGRVNLMTIHSAKGLEFEIVFLPGVEDGIIPHARALEESEGDMEEERRLFYVAITRARRKLYISACRKRRVMRDVAEMSPSPFLDEIPRDLMVFHQEEEPVSREEATDYFAALKNRLGAGARP